MKKSAGLISFYLLAIVIITFQQASAQCPDHSWITELHSKRMAINCKAAESEISAVIDTFKSALQSSRSVEIDNFGAFRISAGRKNNKSESAQSASRRISFKASAALLMLINNSLEPAKKSSQDSNKKVKLH